MPVDTTCDECGSDLRETGECPNRGCRMGPETPYDVYCPLCHRTVRCKDGEEYGHDAKCRTREP